MDAEMIRKVGKLASELLNHGMAKDSQEATLLAQRMLDKNREMETSKVIQTDKPQEQDDTEIRVTFRKINNCINEQNKVINMLQKRISELVSEIEQLKKNQQARPIVLEKKQEEPQTHLKKDHVEKRENPRSGNYSPNDVSIEKFFYSGPPK